MRPMEIHAADGFGGHVGRVAEMDRSKRVAKQNKGALKTTTEHAKRFKVEVVTDPEKGSKEMIDKPSRSRSKRQAGCQSAGSQ